MLTEQQIKHVAKLAKLELADNEVEKFQKQLSEVLDYFNILNEVDTERIEPTSQVTGLENVMREDKPVDSLSQEESLSGTNKTEKKMFKVEKII